MKRLLLILVMMMTSALLSAQVIHVPGDQPNIQAGIDAATNGDVVLVDDGTYYENINFRGKAITVASLFWDDGDTNHINNTIIDGSQPVNPDSASVVVFNSGEDTTTVLYGFSITGGQGGCYNVNWDCYVGGGIALFNSGARISHNKIYGNEVNSGAVFGAAGGGIGGIMTNEFPWIIIEHNQVYNNEAIANNYSGFGGGMYIGTNCMISYNEVYNNSCTNSNPNYASGGGIEIEELPGNPE